MRLPRLLRRRATVGIEVDLPNTLERIELLNATLIRLSSDARLVEVLRADYAEGRLEVVVEHGRGRRRRPEPPPGASVHFRPVA